MSDFYCKSKQVENTRLTINRKVHFTFGELKCPCCGKVVVNQNFLNKLEDFRCIVGKPIHVNRGTRCKKYNDSLDNSSKNSAHLYGCAADIVIEGYTAEQIVTLWKKLGFGYAYTNNGKMKGVAHVQSY